jgi:hypothetical protein
MNDYSDEEELIVRKATFEAGKSKGIELGRKQGVVEGEIKGYKNIIFCLKRENKRFKKKINPYINNSELEQFTREQIQEIKRFIIEVKEEMKK